MKDRATLDLFETDSQDDMRLPAGIDEAGRGPLAGPVYAAAVILNPLNPIEGLKDSKKLTPSERNALAPIIQERSLAWSVAFATVEEIDSMNILEATLLAMKRAVLGLSIRPTILLIDGNRMPHMPYRIRTIIKGDDRIPEISAASIWPKRRTTRFLSAMPRSIRDTHSSTTWGTARPSTWQLSSVWVFSRFIERPSSRLQHA